jgi:hypothetical protein
MNVGIGEVLLNYVSAIVCWPQSAEDTHEVPQIKECEMFVPDSSEATFDPVSIPRVTQGAALMSWLSDCQHLMFQL